MIDDEGTFKKYGYYARDFGPCSKKIVVMVCDGCGKIRERAKKAYTPLCKSCAHKGRVVSIESRRKMSESGKGKIVTEETRKKQSRMRKGNKNANWRGGKIKCICKVCGKEFHVDPYKIKEGHGIFCSLKCYGVYETKTLKGENNPNWKGGNIKRICKTCGKEFEVHRFAVESGIGFFCSMKCMGIAKRGEESPLWKGGISFGKYCEKWNEEFREYIRAKIGRVCFLCGKTEEENGRKLSVHHVSYDKDCGCAKTEEEKKADDATCQFVPLCGSCHSKVHADKDREKWQKFFMSKLRTKLNGWYI